MLDRFFPKQIPTNPAHTPLPQDNFNTVYRIIQRQDKPALLRLLDEGHPISIYQNGNTPISLIARQGYFGHIRWLTDVINMPYHEAVFGFAKGNHCESAQSYVDAHPCSKIELAAYSGYGVYGSHQTAFEKISISHQLAYLEGLGIGKQMALLTTALKTVQHPKAKQYALLGLAKGGHLPEIDAWLQKEPASNQESAAIIFGLSINGKHKSAFRYANHQPLPQTTKLICQGLAVGGHKDVVDIYLREAKKSPEPEHFEHVLWEAIQGYGEGGHFLHPGIITRLLTQADDSALRIKYAKLIEALWAPNINWQDICVKANNLNLMMQCHAMSYETALTNYHPLVDSQTQDTALGRDPSSLGNKSAVSI